MPRIGSVTIYEEGGPDFIWNALKAREVLRKEGKSTAELFELPSIYKDIESFHECITCRDIPQEVVNHAFPDHYRAWQWYLSAYPSSPRWYLEALLLSDLSLYEISKKLGDEELTLSIDVYKRAFFNVSKDKRNNLGWMRQYIWVPGMSHITNLYYYDFIYKAAAVYGSVYLLDSLISPDVLSPAALSWAQQMVRDTRARYMLTSGNTYINLNTDNDIIVQENIMRSWDAVNKETASSSANITDDAMTRLIEAVGNTAKLLSSGASNKNTETFNSAKYSDADIKL